MAFLLVLLMSIVFAKQRQIVHREFSLDMAEDMAQIVWDVYYDESEIGEYHGRDKTWKVKSPIGCVLGDNRRWKEGYVYEYTESPEGELPICLIGIRGTENVEDAYQDALLTATKIIDQTTGEEFWGHRGALELIGCYQFVSEYVNENCNKKALYLAGHSLGGAIVNILSVGLLHGIHADFPGETLDFTINKVEHNIQTYSISAMKPWTLPYEKSAFENELHAGVMEYQNNIPCPAVLSEHSYRIFHTYREPDSLKADFPSLSKPLVLFRFCSQGYELDMKTAILTHYKDLHAPDFTHGNYATALELHTGMNAIDGLGAPISVYVDQGCTEKLEVELNDSTKYREPGMHNHVRCCSGKDECTSRNIECPGKKTFWDAEKWCDSLDMHVCEADELHHCCGFMNDNCYYNDNEVWTSNVIKANAETKVREYPVLDASDSNCRGIHCDATQTGIMIPKLDQMEKIYQIDITVDENKQKPSQGGIYTYPTQEVSLAASLRLPKEELTASSKPMHDSMPRYIFILLLGCAVALVTINTLTKRKTDSLLDYEDLVDSEI